jgi:hypothetical protein
MVLLQREMQKVVGLLHFGHASGKESGPRGCWGSAKHRLFAGFVPFRALEIFICKPTRQ